MTNTGHVRAARPNRGSVALKKCGESPEQIARRTGAKITIVRDWLSGRRKPGREWRDRLQGLYGLELDAWDFPIEFEPPAAVGLLDALQSKAPVAQQERAPDCTGPGPGSSPGGGSTPTTAGEQVRELVDQVRRHRALVDADPVVTLDEKAKILGRCAQTLALVYKLTGEASDISEAKILKSPAWGRISAAIEAALVPWPDAMRAVGEALISLAQDS